MGWQLATTTAGLFGRANFNTYFGAARFAGKPWYGGHYGADNDNHFDLFEAGGMKFIVIFIEDDYSMTSTTHPVLVWANNLLQTYSYGDRRAIVVAHNLLYGDPSRNFSIVGADDLQRAQGQPQPVPDAWRTFGYSPAAH